VVSVHSLNPLAQAADDDGMHLLVAMLVDLCLDAGDHVLTQFEPWVVRMRIDLVEWNLLDGHIANSSWLSQLNF
jgi:hypothetical protein